MLPNHLGLHALSLKLCHTKWVLDTFIKSTWPKSGRTDWQFQWNDCGTISLSSPKSQHPTRAEFWILCCHPSRYLLSLSSHFTWYLHTSTIHIKLKFIQIKWCLVCGGWCSLCLNVLSGWWPAAAVCLMFAVQDILHWVNTPACCGCLLLVLTYHEQHCVETGPL